MKILLVTGTPDRPEQGLFEGLRDRGHQIQVACAPESVEKLQQRGISATPIALRSRFDFRASASLRETVNGFKPDIVHAFTARGVAAAARALRGRRTPIVTYRGTIGHLSWFDPSAWASYLHPRVSAIVCVSDAVRLYLEKFGVSPEKLVTIYKGHELQWYADQEAASRSTLGIPPSAFVATFVGNMRPVKGADLLLKAARYLPTDGSVHLLFIGEVRDRSMKRLINQGVPPYVHLLGYQKEPHRYVKISDAFVMPSREREGLPKAVIEAMAVGVAPIVSDIGGMPELVQNETSGLVVPPNDPRAIAEAILRLAQNPALRESCARNARLRIENTFTVHNTVEQHLSLYQRLREPLKK